MTNAWVKDPFEVQDPTDCSVAEYEKFTDMVSDSTLRLTFKKLPSVQFWCSNKEEYPRLSEKAKILLPFLNYIFWGQNFLIYFSQNNISQQIVCGSRYENLDVFLIKPEIKGI